MRQSINFDNPKNYASVYLELLNMKKEEDEMESRKPRLTVGFMSLLNFGSYGYREGLWYKAAEVFMSADVDFVILCGGLIASKALKKQIDSTLVGLKGDEKHLAERRGKTRYARYLAKKLPVMKGKKICILTSPAPAHDSDLGLEIARSLAQLREDIVIWDQDSGNGSIIEFLRGAEINLGLYNPTKSFLGTGYASTKPDSILENAGSLGDFNVVGCFANFLLNPGPSSQTGKPRLVLPGLCSIGEKKHAERSIGVVVVKFWSENISEVTATMYDFKELVEKELSYVKPPSNSTKLQRKIIKVLKEKRSQPLGGFEDLIGGYSRKEIKEALDDLLKKRANKSWPGLKYGEVSTKYFFNTEWFQRSLRYRVPKRVKKTRQETSLLGVCCPHIGCKTVNLSWILDDIPKSMLECDAQYLVCPGDIAEGLKHNLREDGSLSSSDLFAVNYTWQQSWAAWLFGEAMMKVFRERMGKYDLKDCSQKEIYQLIEKCLVTLIYIPGNHDAWNEANQNDVLGTFSRDLEFYLLTSLSDYFVQKGINLSGDIRLLLGIVNEKAVRLEVNRAYQLSSGLEIPLLHPYMGGTKTRSIRVENAIKMTSGQLVFLGNFHTTEIFLEWVPGRGLCIGVQIGTLKQQSSFERNKMKLDLDSNYVEVKVASMVFKKGEKPRITEVTVTIMGQKEDPDFFQKSNLKIRDQYEAWRLARPNHIPRP